MTRLSFRLRLFVAGSISILVALALATWGLSVVFYRHLERAAEQEMGRRIESLVVAAATEGPSGPNLDRAVFDRLMPDPAYDLPYSGRYWRVSWGDVALQSRSLWDDDLALPEAAMGLGDLAGPRGQSLLVMDRQIAAHDGAGGSSLRITVAMDRQELDAARLALLRDLAPYLAVLVLGLVAANALQVQVGLRPFAVLGRRLNDLESARTQRLNGEDLPQEVRPLAQRIDDLLSAREEEGERARRRAGALAHGLKTPLQALLGEAVTLRSLGLAPRAEAIEQTVQQMRLQVDHELARTRLTPALSAECEAREIAQGLIAVLMRTADGSGLDWAITGADELRLRIDRAELAEALGALAENAARHATSRVEITLRDLGSTGVVSVVDDGPGVPPDELRDLADWSAPRDQRSDGSGLGLTMAYEIAEARGGRLTLRNLTPGFEAALFLPAAT